MIYKSYGNTGIRVSAIGFGGMRFDMVRQNEMQHIDLVRYAFERGITYFDTAPGYCDDQSEIIFGKAFAAMPREKFTVSTKLMPGHIKTAQEAYERILRSRDRLQVDTIDIFHAWNFRTMAHYNDCIRPDGLYEAMLRAKADGVVRHLAFSTHLTGDAVSKVVASGRFEGVLLGLNILNFPYRLAGVRAARQRGMGVVAMNSLYGGLIPQYEDKFRFIARQGESPTLAALRFVAGLELLDVALNGFTTFEHVDLACAAADSATPLGEAELAELGTLLGEGFSGFCTGCGYCKDCPARICVPAFMQFYNQKLIAGIPDDQMVENLRGNRVWGVLPESWAKAGDCLHCGRCEAACTQHLPIINRLEEIAGWEKIADAGSTVES